MLVDQNLQNSPNYVLPPVTEEVLEFTQLQTSQFPHAYAGSTIQDFQKMNKKRKCPLNYRTLKEKIFVKVFQYNDYRTAVVDNIVFDNNLELGEKMTEIDNKRARLTEVYDYRMANIKSRMREVPSNSVEYSTLEVLKRKLFGRAKANMLSINLGTDLAIYDGTSNATNTTSSRRNSDLDMLDYLNQLDVYINDYDPTAEALAHQIFNNLIQE